MFEGTLTARWLRFQIKRDPRLERDPQALLEEFAGLEGLQASEMGAHFLRDEAQARDREEAQWWLRAKARTHRKGE